MRRCELLARSKELGQARECLHNYRKQYPDAPRHQQAVLLLATISRVEGRWSEAAAYYNEYLKHSSDSKETEQALYHRFQCLKLAKQTGIHDAALEYLKRYPNGPHVEELKQWQAVQQNKIK